jgi:hypothetical protein
MSSATAMTDDQPKGVPGGHEEETFVSYGNLYGSSYGLDFGYYYPFSDDYFAVTEPDAIYKLSHKPAPTLPLAAQMGADWTEHFTEREHSVLFRPPVRRLETTDDVTIKRRLHSGSSVDSNTSIAAGLSRLVKNHISVKGFQPVGTRQDAASVLYLCSRKMIQSYRGGEVLRWFDLNGRNTEAREELAGKLDQLCSSEAGSLIVQMSPVEDTVAVSSEVYSPAAMGQHDYGRLKEVEARVNYLTSQVALTSGIMDVVNSAFAFRGSGPNRNVSCFSESDEAAHMLLNLDWESVGSLE